MNNYLSRRVMIVSSVIIGAMIFAAPDAESSQAAYISGYEWVSESSGISKGVAFSLDSDSPPCLGQRLYLRTSTGRLITVTQNIFVRDGIFLNRFYDQESDWWAERRNQIPLRFQSTADVANFEVFLNQVHSTIGSVDKPLLETVLSTSGGLELRHSIEELKGDATIEEMFPPGLSTFGEKVRHKMPPGQAEVFMEVRSMLCPDGENGTFCLFAELLEPFANALAVGDQSVQSEDSELDNWTEYEFGATRGNTLEPKQRDFLSMFDEFKVGNPFSGLCEPQSHARAQ